MKRFFAVIALALCITIGGTYATWSYSASEDILDDKQQKFIQMANAVSSGADGSYSVDASGVSFLIDDTNGDHHPELVPNGNLILTFTPAANAPTSVENNGVQSYFNIVPHLDSAVNENWLYNTQNIFTFDFEEHTILTANDPADPDPANNTLKWTKDGADLKCTIPASTLATHFPINGAIELDTKAAYDAYAAVLARGYLEFRLSDHYVPVTP